jgi:Spermine/spermidine synthase domain
MCWFSCQSMQEEFKLRRFIEWASAKENELFLLSLSSLFVELLFIRWLSSDFRSLCVFKAFPLATCLVGLGAGSALAQNEKLAAKIYLQFPFALYIASAAVRVLSLTFLSYFFLPSINLYQWSEVHANAPEFLLYQALFMVFLLVLLAGPFFACLCIGARIGSLFNALPPLKAYCINIGGAVLGSLLFLISCYAWLPLWVMFLCPTVIAVLCLPQESAWYRKRSIVLLVGALLAVGLPSRGPVSYWSPYSKIEAFPIESTQNGQTKQVGTFLNVGRLVHQVFLPKVKLDAGENMSPEFMDAMNLHNDYYDLLFTIVPHPHNVLVLGGGMGMDSWEFLRRGVDSIDAVEIDPLVAHLGYVNNPAYSDPKVHVIIDDARHYVRTCSKKYDLVFLACLDSSTLAGLSSSTRVDSYVHTKECFAAVKRVLSPDGLMALSFGSGGYKWLRERIRHTLEQAFGYSPLVYDGKTFFFFIGEPIRNGTLTAPTKTAAYEQVAAVSTDWDGKILNDDWPFLYMRNDQFDLPFVLVLLEVVALSLFAGRKLLFSKETKYWSMFFLGSAFMLIELCAISRLALLYSATAITASLVIITILLMILLANLLILKRGDTLARYLNIIYVLLISSLVAVYFVPIESFLSSYQQGSLLGNAAITLLSLIPCFFAALVFAIRFRGVEMPSRAVAFNLFGCVAGALLEYLSNLWGLKSLLLVAALLYMCSWKAKD